MDEAKRLAIYVRMSIEGAEPNRLAIEPLNTWDD